MEPLASPHDIQGPLLLIRRLFLPGSQPLSFSAARMLQKQNFQSQADAQGDAGGPVLWAVAFTLWLCPAHTVGQEATGKEHVDKKSPFLGFLAFSYLCCRE